MFLSFWYKIQGFKGGSRPWKMPSTVKRPEKGVTNNTINARRALKWKEGARHALNEKNAPTISRCIYLLMCFEGAYGNVNESREQSFSVFKVIDLILLTDRRNITIFLLVNFQFNFRLSMIWYAKSIIICLGCPYKPDFIFYFLIHFILKNIEIT